MNCLQVKSADLKLSVSEFTIEDCRLYNRFLIDWQY